MFFGKVKNEIRKSVIVNDTKQIGYINSFLIKNCFEACVDQSGEYLLKITGVKKEIHIVR